MLQLDRMTLRICSLRNLFHPVLGRMERRTVLASPKATASVQRCGARAFAQVARKTSRSHLEDGKTASLEGAL
jgi:hypothetical protein